MPPSGPAEARIQRASNEQHEGQLRPLGERSKAIGAPHRIGPQALCQAARSGAPNLGERGIAGRAPEGIEQVRTRVVGVGEKPGARAEQQTRREARGAVVAKSPERDGKPDQPEPGEDRGQAAVPGLDVARIAEQPGRSPRQPVAQRGFDEPRLGVEIGDDVIAAGVHLLRGLHHQRFMALQGQRSRPDPRHEPGEDQDQGDRAPPRRRPRQAVRQGHALRVHKLSGRSRVPRQKIDIAEVDEQPAGLPDDEYRVLPMDGVA